MTTSALPKSKYPFTKDTLEGDYKGYRREIWSRAAYDEGANGNGVAMLYFALVKPDKDAIVFGLFTGWSLPETVEKWKTNGIYDLRPAPEGAAVDFHWAEPQFEGDKIDATDCTLIDGGECYGNTGFTIGEKVFEALIRGGLDAVWKILFQYLRQQESPKE